MKRYVLVSSIVLLTLFATPCLAAITIIAQDAGNGLLTIGYESTDCNPIAFDIQLEFSNKAFITDSSQVMVYPPFLFFPEYAYYNPVNYSVGRGHPVVGNSLKFSAFEVSPNQNPENLGPIDLNMDGFVNMNDLMRFVSEWKWGVGPADFNGDGVVNLSDAAIMFGDFVQTPLSLSNLVTIPLTKGKSNFTDVSISVNGIYDAAGNACDVILPDDVRVLVPEPTTVCLLAFGGLLLQRKRRR